MSTCTSLPTIPFLQIVGPNCTLILPIINLHQRLWSNLTHPCLRRHTREDKAIAAQSNFQALPFLQPFSYWYLVWALGSTRGPRSPMIPPSFSNVARSRSSMCSRHIGPTLISPSLVEISSVSSHRKRRRWMDGLCSGKSSQARCLDNFTDGPSGHGEWRSLHTQHAVRNLAQTLPHAPACLCGSAINPCRPPVVSATKEHDSPVPAFRNKLKSSVLISPCGHSSCSIIEAICVWLPPILRGVCNAPTNQAGYLHDNLNDADPATAFEVLQYLCVSHTATHYSAFTFPCAHSGCGMSASGSLSFADKTRPVPQTNIRRVLPLVHPNMKVKMEMGLK